MHPAHIAGRPDRLTQNQREWIDLAATLGRNSLAPRAAKVDRDAVFPRENFDDLRRAGLLALCVPAAQGGMGADFASYALTAAELGRHCAATALSWNMHASVTMWSGFVADTLDMTSAERADHQRCRDRHFQRIVDDGKIYAQPFSEGGPAAAGAAPFGTLAQRVAGGYVVNGRKIFASMAGEADYYAVLCTLERPGASLAETLYLALPADAPGITVSGMWDPLGMRGTVSRDLDFKDVFVPDDGRLLPEGLYWQAARRFPHLHSAVAAPYLGLAQGAYDFTLAYLRGEAPHASPVKRRMYPTKQHAVAQMRIQLEQMRALYFQCAQEAGADPDRDSRLRLYAAQYAVMEGAHDIAQLALRTCGGQAMLKSLPLERMYRDSRCGSLMLPWTAELCIDRLGRECLYDPDERDEAIE